MRTRVGFGGGDVNFYAYVRNDPINLIDAFGLCPGDKYPNKRCARWNAENDYDPISRRRNREYGGFIYQNADRTFSYTDPSANNNAGIGTPDSIPHFWNITIPAGTQRAGWYHTHAAFDAGMNAPGNPAPGQTNNPGYYDLAGRNSAQFSRDVLNAGGVKTGRGPPSRASYLITSQIRRPGRRRLIWAGALRASAAFSDVLDE